MSAKLFFLPFPTAFSSNGLPAAGAKLYFYYTGTTTPAPTYTTSGLTTANSNPVVADSSGHFAPIYLDSSIIYRLVIKDSAGTQLGSTIDPYIPGATNPSVTITNATSLFSINSRSAMAGITSPTDGQSIILTEEGKEGIFFFSSSDHSVDVTADSLQAIYIPPTSDTDGSSGAWVRIHEPGVAYATWFGAIGDGSTGNTSILNTAIAYCLANGITLLKIGAGVFNITNVTIPALGPQSANPSNYAQLEIRGVAPPANIQGDVGSTGALVNTGTILKSSATTGSALAVLPYGGSFSNVKITLTNLEVRTYNNPTCSGVDMGWAAQFEYESLNINTGTWGGAISAPTTNTSFGLKYPRRGNFGVSYGRNSQVCGYFTGRVINELANIDQDLTIYCHLAASLTEADHAIKLGYFGVFNCIYGISVDGNCRFSVDFYDAEHAASGWSVNVADLYDPTSAGRGWINWSTVEAVVANTDHFVKDGGDKIICTRIGSLLPHFNQFASGATPVAVSTGTVTQIPLANLGAVQNESGFTISGGALVVTVPGWYRLTCAANFASNSTGYRELRQYKNSAFGFVNQPAVNGSTTSMNYFGEGYFVAGDSVELYVLQNSGSTLDVTASITMTMLRTAKG